MLKLKLQSVFTFILASIAITGGCRISEVPYEGSSGNSDKVPFPWKSVSISGNTVSISGRTYEFAAGPLPVSIKSAGKELFDTPPGILLNGGKEHIAWDKFTVGEKKADRISLLFSGCGGGIQWQAKAMIAYDGFIRVCLKGTPETACDCCLTGLYLNFPLKSENATMYTHQLVRTRNMGPWRFLSRNPEKLYNAGALPKTGWRGQFTPQLWVGGLERGFAFMSDSPAGWLVGSDENIMSLVPSGGRVDMRISPVNRKSTLKQAWQFEFGMIATPLRTPRKGLYVRRIMFTGGSDIDTLTRQFAPEKFDDSELINMAGNGVKTILLWNHWSGICGFPQPQTSKHAIFLKRAVEYSHRLGMKVIVYLNLMSSLPDAIPDFEHLAQKFNYVKAGYDRDYWNKNIKMYKVRINDEFIKWYTGLIRDLIEKYDIDGIYMDTHHPNEYYHTGKRISYDHYQHRKLYEAIYRLFHGEVKQEGIVYLHDSEPPLYMFAGFADVILTGEASYYLKATRKQTSPKLENLGDRFPFAEIFAFNSGIPIGKTPSNWCLKPEKKQYSSVGKDNIGFGTGTCGDIMSNIDAFTIIGLFNMGISVPPRIKVKKSPEDMKYAIWKLENKISGPGTIWIPPWQIESYLRMEKPSEYIKAAAFVAPGRGMLIHLANLNAKAAEVNLSLLPASGLIGKSLVIEGKICGRPKTTVKLDKDSLKCRVPGNSFVRILLFSKE